MAEKFNWTIIAVVLIIVAGALIGISFLKSPEEKTVSVTGIAEMKAEPDLVAVNIMVQTKDKSAESAKNKNSEITDKVLRALKFINERDVSTENYNIYPEYDWSEGKQKLIGYTATNYVNVESKNFDDAGKIVDVAVDSGALVNYINYEISTEKSNELKAKLLADASADARNKADAIATGLGRKLGSVVSVSASDYNYIPYPLFRGGVIASVANEEAKSIATNLPAKDIDLSANVNVVYEIN